MSKLLESDSQTKWNRRHSERELGSPACEVLLQHLDLLPDKGYALDLACGLGRNAIQLAKCGLECDAVDISDVALARLHTFARQHELNINTHCVDIENDGIGDKQYDVIVVSYFLHRPLLAKIVQALKPGGLLFYQTFLRSDTTTGNSNHHKTNNRFYLDKNELRAQFKSLKIRYYQETSLKEPSSTAPVAMLLASKAQNNNVA
ncbi:Tellurite methyltransferase [Zhongshania aliphaticivorans]|uniref:Tellurite methyltransferase n=1 Tax=Zhongshania aliphaticivorans TaxID=1470434 RepID=A0A5S9PL64_9GAMM|nr:class I SAM-dependent methyltransferase [Zhongshania aliphaticivorans]CAA0104515.1 Tellurite methyltransferase [Zhongshania aliphaticivorans]CAA0104770.1 Tellurite methyltransferase [Zhongshania aliphaticivorans]